MHNQRPRRQSTGAPPLDPAQQPATPDHFQSANADPISFCSKFKMQIEHCDSIRGDEAALSGRLDRLRSQLSA
ncbi:hypothetical protein T07_7610 [Trichinella nelsoni]|uniref:Uncharacterized protein n=1 Tax=Trichinella nelsoni TaxID=6336 RepID=A0A0V0SJY7_9BILA|nr:hypothetical protein T07_7610 [Trichinella nelsoni]